MRGWIAMSGAATVLVLTVLPVGAAPRDSVERGERMDRDAMRDDVRVNRLKIPQNPIVVEQPPQPASGSGKTSRSGKGAGTRR